VSPADEAKERAVTHTLLRNAEVCVSTIAVRLRSSPDDADPFEAGIAIDEVQFRRRNTVGHSPTANGSSGDDDDDTPTSPDNDTDRVCCKEVAILGLSAYWKPTSAEPRGSTVEHGEYIVLHGVAATGLLTMSAVAGVHGSYQHSFELHAREAINVLLGSEQFQSVVRHAERWRTPDHSGRMFDLAPRIVRMSTRERWQYAAFRVLAKSTSGEVCWPAVRSFCALKHEYITALQTGPTSPTIDKLEAHCSVQEVVLFRHLASLQRVVCYKRSTFQRFSRWTRRADVADDLRESKQSFLAELDKLASSEDGLDSATQSASLSMDELTLTLLDSLNPRGAAVLAGGGRAKLLEIKFSDIVLSTSVDVFEKIYRSSCELGGLGVQV
jgi:hypothetical protein